MQLTQTQFADLLQVKPPRITVLIKEGRLVKDDEKRIDTNDETNRALLRQHFHRQYLATEGSDDEEGELVEQKLKADIEYTNERKRKVALENERITRELVPFEIVRDGLGAFASSLRNNVLTLGDRIARGDSELRDKIENATAQAIEKTIQAARSEIERITEVDIEVPEDEEDG